MTVAFLAPYLRQQFFAPNGEFLSYGLVYSYEASTTTPIATFTDSTGSIQNTNPVVLDAYGSCSIWLIPNTGYKLSVFDQFGNQLPGYPVDQIYNQQEVFFGGVDTGSVNAYIVDYDAGFTSLTNGIILYFIAANSNTGPSTLNVNSLGAVPILNQSGTALGAGQITAGGVTSVLYYNGNWLLTSVIGSIQQNGSFVATLTGFATTVTATVQYRIYNNVAYMFFDTTNPTGTSNATTMTMTGLPAVMNPSVDKFILCCTEDNGNTEQFSALAISSSGTCTFQKYLIGTGEFSSVGFTTAGAKGLPPDWSVSYPLT
jgi:hypothetical protein